jgi:hypothetical protein
VVFSFKALSAKREGRHTLESDDELDSQLERDGVGCYGFPPHLTLQLSTRLSL